MYEALTLLWLRSEDRYVQPGERLALPDDDAAVLIARGLIAACADDPAAVLFEHGVLTTPMDDGSSDMPWAVPDRVAVSPAAVEAAPDPHVADEPAAE